MYRTNAQSRALEEAFVKYGISYKLVGGVGFYKRREVRDLVAYLRVINNPNEAVSFERDRQRAGARHRQEIAGDSSANGRRPAT